MGVKNLSISDLNSFSKELKDELLTYARARIDYDDYLRKYKKRQISGGILMFAFLLFGYFMKHVFKEAYVLVPKLTYIDAGFKVIAVLILILMLLTHWLANLKSRKKTMGGKAEYFVETHNLIVETVPPEELWAALTNQKATA